MARIGFIGLGTMGAPMAGHLATAGHQVVAYNRSSNRAGRWLSKHPACHLAATPREAAENADFVLTCVGNDDDLRAVLLGDNGALGGMTSGSMLIDHTTASAEVAREIAAACSELGIDFLDAPVSGGQAGAENAALSIMVGGSRECYEKAVPILLPYTKAIERMGDVGAGQLTKMVNQICAAGVIQGLAEGLNFGEQAGLDMESVIKVVSAGAAGSWQMENRASTMLKDEFDFGFAIDWMRKDLDICLNEAKQIDAELPHISLINQHYKKLQQLGGGRWDTSALIKLLKPLPQ